MSPLEPDARTPSSSTISGERLGRYQLLTPLAVGGMAEVFVARALGEGGFQRLVAIKRILPELVDDPSFVDMFLDEGRIAGLVTSPNVVQVLDVARAEDGTLYMVLELVRGVALHELLRTALARGTILPVPVLVGILAQAADGLAAAHEAVSPEGEPMNIVHRDISPQNILVGVDGRTRIADFGIAHALHRRSRTTPGELRGKLGYFAPEQVGGKPATRRSDVFALSVVAWEALAGRRLFHGGSAVDILRQIRIQDAPPLHALRGDVPPELAAAIARGLAKRPDARPATARELAAALRESAREATAGEVGRVVRDLVGTTLDRLDAQIRLALEATDAKDGRAPRVSRDLEATTTPTVGPDLFEIDSDTTTQLVTLSSDASPPGDDEPTTARPAPRASWSRWAALAVVGLALTTLGAAVLGARVAAPVPGDAPPETGDRPAASSGPLAMIALDAAVPSPPDGGGTTSPETAEEWDAGSPTERNDAARVRRPPAARPRDAGARRRGLAGPDEFRQTLPR